MTRYVSAEKLTHDDFNDRFTGKEGEIVYDAQTHYGPWACMSEKSYKEHGTGHLGLGMGQKYQRTADGRLVKIEG